MIRTGLHLGSTSSGSKSQSVVSCPICTFEVVAAHKNFAISLFYFYQPSQQVCNFAKTSIPQKALNSSSKMDMPAESGIEGSKNLV